MKSLLVLTAAWSIATASFIALEMPASKTTAAPKMEDTFVADGIMLPEVVISSMPSYEMPEIVITPAHQNMMEMTLPEVTIVASRVPKA